MQAVGWSSYSSRKLELLALKWAVTEKFQEYLIASTFTVFTNDNSLTCVHAVKVQAESSGAAVGVRTCQLQLQHKVPGRKAQSEC